MARKFNPTGDNIVVRLVEVERKTAGGVHLPSTAQAFQNEAIVLEVGPGKLREDGSRLPMESKVGDLVGFEGVAIEIMIDGRQALVIRDSQVRGKPSAPEAESKVIVPEPRVVLAS